MISLDEALALTLEAAHPLEAVTVPLEQAAGRVLAAGVTARSDSPLSDVTAMDGYAVRSTDVEVAGARLAVIGQSLPGQGFQGVVSIEADATGTAYAMVVNAER